MLKSLRTQALYSRPRVLTCTSFCRHVSSSKLGIRPQMHAPAKIPHRFYMGGAPRAQSAFGPSYAALLAIVSGMLGYGFARATIASDRQQEHTKVVSYGSAGEIALAERELRVALPSKDAVSVDKLELADYGSSENS